MTNIYDRSTTSKHKEQVVSHFVMTALSSFRTFKRSPSGTNGMRAERASLDRAGNEWYAAVRAFHQ